MIDNYPLDNYISIQTLIKSHSDLQNGIENNKHPSKPIVKMRHQIRLIKKLIH
ncbi:hypothetical protein KFK09_022564 [Dendrobium nobile]|uniref:Uncharacterized protein n=1 Tax=Dendrobium nobile TaxID=94219 RepID=A0A8T3AJG6_DENNO|nr:hypothetical protein KFK09_022564 [Dendrobium nobile]